MPYGDNKLMAVAHVPMAALLGARCCLLHRLLSAGSLLRLSLAPTLCHVLGLAKPQRWHRGVPVAICPLQCAWR